MAALMFAYPIESGITTGKFVRRRKSDGAYWSTVGVAFEAYNAANIANYGIAATENGVSGDYSATDPAETTEGDYRFVKAAGASLAVSDLISGIRWHDRAGPEAGVAVLDLAAGVETGLTVRQALRLITAISAGKLSGAATTTIVIRNAVADDKNRISATVDSSGNRSAITVDLT